MNFIHLFSVGLITISSVSCWSGQKIFDNGLNKVYIYDWSKLTGYNYTEAKQFCYRESASMVKIASLQESTFLSHHVDFRKRFWVGSGTVDSSVPTEFDNGQKIYWFNWNDGQPTISIAKCSAISVGPSHDGSHEKWFLEPCNGRVGSVVCERPLDIIRIPSDRNNETDLEAMVKLRDLEIEKLKEELNQQRALQADGEYVSQREIAEMYESLKRLSDDMNSTTISRIPDDHVHKSHLEQCIKTKDQIRSELDRKHIEDIYLELDNLELKVENATERAMSCERNLIGCQTEKLNLIRLLEECPKTGNVDKH